jgi:hypothetical protein
MRDTRDGSRRNDFHPVAKDRMAGGEYPIEHEGAEGDGDGMKPI